MIGHTSAAIWWGAGRKNCLPAMLLEQLLSSTAAALSIHWHCRCTGHLSPLQLPCCWAHHCSCHAAAQQLQYCCTTTADLWMACIRQASGLAVQYCTGQGQLPCYPPHPLQLPPPQPQTRCRPSAGQAIKTRMYCQHPLLGQRCAIINE